MNSKNSKTFDFHRLLLNLADKINLKRSDKYVALLNLNIHYAWKNIKKPYNNKFKILAPTWNEEFELPDKSYFMSDIQDYFEYIFKKKDRERTDNPSVRIYINKIGKRITFKTRYYLELLLSETMKLLGSTKRKITKNENGEGVPNFEITEVHCNIINNNDQQNSRALYIFVPNKSLGQLLDISSKNFIF